MTRIRDYRVCSAAGAVISTFDDRERALKWARDMRETFPGLYVEAVTTTVERETLYRARIRPQLRIVA